MKEVTSKNIENSKTLSDSRVLKKLMNTTKHWVCMLSESDGDSSPGPEYIWAASGPPGHLQKHEWNQNHYTCVDVREWDLFRSHPCAPPVNRCLKISSITQSLTVFPHQYHQELEILIWLWQDGHLYSIPVAKGVPHIKACTVALANLGQFTSAPIQPQQESYIDGYNIIISVRVKMTPPERALCLQSPQSYEEPFKKHDHSSLSSFGWSLKRVWTEVDYQLHRLLFH